MMCSRQTYRAACRYIQGCVMAEMDLNNIIAEIKKRSIPDGSCISCGKTSSDVIIAYDENNADVKGVVDDPMLENIFLRSGACYKCNLCSNAITEKIGEVHDQYLKYGKLAANRRFTILLLVGGNEDGNLSIDTSLFHSEGIDSNINMEICVIGGKTITDVPDRISRIWQLNPAASVNAEKQSDNFALLLLIKLFERDCPPEGKVVRICHGRSHSAKEYKLAAFAKSTISSILKSKSDFDLSRKIDEIKEEMIATFLKCYPYDTGYLPTYSCLGRFTAKPKEYVYGCYGADKTLVSEILYSELLKKAEKFFKKELMQNKPQYFGNIPIQCFELITPDRDVVESNKKRISVSYIEEYKEAWLEDLKNDLKGKFIRAFNECFASVRREATQRKQEFEDCRVLLDSNYTISETPETDSDPPNWLTIDIDGLLCYEPRCGEDKFECREYERIVLQAAGIVSDASSNWRNLIFAGACVDTINCSENRYRIFVEEGLPENLIFTGCRAY